MIRQLSISNFRAFDDLSVSQLGRVNLIVGKNNVGKTALMEAIQFYVRGADASALSQYLFEKDEIIILNSPNGEFDTYGANFAALFHNYKRNFLGSYLVEITDNYRPQDSLRVYTENVPVQRRTTVIDDEGLSSYQRSALEELNKRIDSTNEVALFVDKGAKSDYIAFSDTIDRQERYRRATPRKALSDNDANIMNIQSGTISQSEIARYWDTITLRDSEKRVLELVREIAPVERITSIQRTSRRSDRIILLKLENHDQPIPLKSMGEGISRVIQIALTLESNFDKDNQMGMTSIFQSHGDTQNYLFIDELENGIHFAALKGVWEFIFKIAELRNIQVFVTSHSWDCIEAFQQVSQQFDSSGVLISLKDKKNRKVATVFSEDELRFISKNDIEVR